MVEFVELFLKNSLKTQMTFVQTTLTFLMMNWMQMRLMVKIEKELRLGICVFFQSRLGA